MVNKVRIFFNWIRGYGIGDPCRNGEYRFLRTFVKDGMVIFDIGANIGEFTVQALSFGGNLEVHCFEPVGSTYGQLRKRLSDPPPGSRLFLNRIGLSDRQGEASMKVYGDCLGTNSLYERPTAVAAHPALASWREMRIPLTTVDTYVNERGVDHIDLMKIDVEGHEFKVLEGAKASLEARKVRCIQFEYGGTFQDSGARLRDIFALLEGYGYQMFRLLPFGRIRIRSFHSRLENFKHSNWLAGLTGNLWRRD